MISNEYILTGQPGRTPNALVGTSGNSPNGRGAYVWYDITPELAAEWLDYNVVNRKSRKVETYAKDMLAGDWRDADAPITRRVDGAVLDGKNRLMAIILSGMTIGAWVHIVSDNVQPMDLRVDIGAPRTVTDITGRDKREAAVARTLLRVAGAKESWVSPSIDVVIDVMDRIDPLFSRLTKTHGRGVASGLGSASVTAATVYAMHAWPGDAESIAAQYDAMALNHFDYPYWPGTSSAMRQTMNVARIKVGGKIQLHRFAQWHRAYSPGGRGLSKIVFKDVAGYIGEFAPKVAAYIGINS